MHGPASLGVRHERRGGRPSTGSGAERAAVGRRAHGRARAPAILAGAGSNRSGRVAARRGRAHAHLLVHGLRFAAAGVRSAAVGRDIGGGGGRGGAHAVDLRQLPVGKIAAISPWGGNDGHSGPRDRGRARRRLERYGRSRRLRAACASRAATVLVDWISRSASVDLPWSIWATMEKLRICAVSVMRGVCGAAPSPSRSGRVGVERHRQWS